MKTTGFAILCTALAACAARNPFTPDDLGQWRWAADALISADGERVVYTECRNDRAANAFYCNLRVVAAAGGPPRSLGDGRWRDTSPRWSPDGKGIAWISDRGGRPQVWIRPREEGPERALTSSELAAAALAWSPEGDAVAFTARVPLREAVPAWAPPTILPRLRPQGKDIVRLFVQRLDTGNATAVSGDEWDIAGEPAWMPDGRSVIAATAAGRFYAFPASGGEARQLSEDGVRATAPLPSPDGSKIAFLEISAAAQSYATRKLAVMRPDGSRVRILSGALDRDADAPQWSSDSRTLYFLADDRGSTHVYAARNDGTLRQVTKAAERLRGLSLADNGRAVTVRTNASAAGDVYTLTVDRASEPATIAAPAAEFLAAREIGSVEEIGWQSAGHAIQGWLVRPPDFDGSRKYPLLLEIRDHPREMYGPEFNLRAQILAARGFVVLCANPRGTPGYGEEFGNLLPTRYPGDDYDDLMRGVDLAAARPYVDGARLAVAGGLLAAWTIGHTTRFRSAVVRRPVVDWVADVALAPGGLEHALSWMHALPWDDPDQYVKHSPINFAGNFRTPTLVLAEEGDPQAEELWFALQNRKVESAFVRLAASPGPADTLLELEAALAWLTR